MEMDLIKRIEIRLTRFIVKKKKQLEVKDLEDLCTSSILRMLK
jgi:hypothetical protein